jgi:hypothetical protein
MNRKPDDRPLVIRCPAFDDDGLVFAAGGIFPGPGAPGLRIPRAPLFFGRIRPDRDPRPFPRLARFTAPDPGEED